MGKVKTKKVKIKDTQIQTFFKKLSSLKTRASKVGIDFNELTKEAVQIVWNVDIGDISAINKCLVVAKDVKGFNEQALLDFYKECIPFTYNKDLGEFTKTNPQTKDKMLATWKSFITSNNWYDYLPEKKDKEFVFSPETIVKQVAKKLEQADENNSLTLSNLLKLQMDLNHAIDAYLTSEPVEQDNDTMTDIEIAELLAMENEVPKLHAVS